MTQNEALHTATRCYCQERARHWGKRYEAIGAHSSTAEGRNLFPRYLILDDILVEILRLVPATFRSLKQARKLVADAAEPACIAMVERFSKDDIAARAVGEEANLFRDFVASIPADALWQVEPLPYRRTLSDPERAQVAERLRERWNVDGFWYPLASEPPAGEVGMDYVAFLVDHFHADSANPTRLLQRELAKRGVERVWEMREFGPEYEISLETFLPTYNGGEGFWTAEPMDWLVYASHENSVTIAGAWLVTGLLRHWPQWRQHQFNWEWINRPLLTPLRRG